jgi:hypothetical protein
MSPPWKIIRLGPVVAHPAKSNASKAQATRFGKYLLDGRFSDLLRDFFFDGLIMVLPLCHILRMRFG